VLDFACRIRSFVAVLFNMCSWGRGKGVVRKGRGKGLRGRGRGKGLGEVWIIVDRTKTAESNVKTGNHCSYNLILFLYNFSSAIQLLFQTRQGISTDRISLANFHKCLNYMVVAKINF